MVSIFEVASTADNIQLIAICVQIAISAYSMHGMICKSAYYAGVQIVYIAICEALMTAERDPVVCKPRELDNVSDDERGDTDNGDISGRRQRLKSIQEGVNLVSGNEPDIGA